MTQRPAGERGPDTDRGCRESPLHARLPLSPVVTSETLRGLQRTGGSSAHAHLLAGRSFMATGVSRVRAARLRARLGPRHSPSALHAPSAFLNHKVVYKLETSRCPVHEAGVRCAGGREAACGPDLGGRGSPMQRGLRQPCEQLGGCLWCPIFKNGRADGRPPGRGQRAGVAMVGCPPASPGLSPARLALRGQRALQTPLPGAPGVAAGRLWPEGPGRVKDHRCPAAPAMTSGLDFPCAFEMILFIVVPCPRTA